MNGARLLMPEEKGGGGRDVGTEAGVGIPVRSSSLIQHKLFLTLRYDGDNYYVGMQRFSTYLYM